MYVNESGIVQIAENGSMIDLFFGLASQHRRDVDSGMFLARHPAFPDPVGVGPSREDAAGRLNAAFYAFMQDLLEKEGLEAFERRLLKNGFEPSRGEENPGGWITSSTARINVYNLEFRKTYQRA